VADVTGGIIGLMPPVPRAKNISETSTDPPAPTYCSGILGFVMSVLGGVFGALITALLAQTS
jgi:hypothetical protein